MILLCLDATDSIEFTVQIRAHIDIDCECDCKRAQAVDSR